MTRTFQDLKEGDHAYLIMRGHGEPYAVVQRLTGPDTPGHMRTLSCYSDGTPMIYFGTMWCRSDGREIMTGREGDRRPQRLVLELPVGMRVAENPKATVPPMPPGIPVGRDAPFDVTTARYAKRKLAVHIRSDGSGYKTRAERLIGDGLNARWSGREKAYIASSAQVEKMQRLYAAGFSACVMTGAIWHHERGLERLSVSEALRLVVGG